MRTKQIARFFSEGVACLLILCSWDAWAAAGHAPSKPAKADSSTNVITKSIFVDDERGRDPFFPNSVRRQTKPLVPEESRVVGPASLVLLGIIGPPDHRIALINNQSFTAGEEQPVRVPGGSNTVIKCTEIRERSVMVTIQGGTEQFELQIQERVIPIAPDTRSVEEGK